MDVPEDENPKPPKKKARAKKPRKKTPPKLSKKKSSSKDNTEFETAVRSLSAFFDLHEDPRKQAWEKNVEVMCSHVEEYMSNFIIIGYTINGEPVNITAAKSQKDLDSLSTALQKYVFDCYSKNMFPPGNGPGM